MRVWGGEGDRKVQAGCDGGGQQEDGGEGQDKVWSVDCAANADECELRDISASDVHDAARNIATWEPVVAMLLKRLQRIPPLPTSAAAVSAAITEACRCCSCTHVTHPHPLAIHNRASVFAVKVAQRDCRRRLGHRRLAGLFVQLAATCGMPLVPTAAVAMAEVASCISMHAIAFACVSR